MAIRLVKDTHDPEKDIYEWDDGTVSCVEFITIRCPKCGAPTDTVHTYSNGSEVYLHGDGTMCMDKTANELVLYSAMFFFMYHRLFED